MTLKPKVRAHYSTLAQIATSFQSQAEITRLTFENLKQHTDSLEGGNWVGQNAQHFYQEMNSAVLPTLQRLTRSLEHAAQTTKTISQMMKQAEIDAARVLTLTPVHAASPATSNPIKPRDPTGHDQRFPGVIQAGEDRAGNTFLLVKTDSGLQWATPIMKGSGKEALVAYDPLTGERGLPLHYNAAGEHYQTSPAPEGLLGGAGLAALLGQNVVTDNQIRATDEYQALAKEVSPEAALLACRLLLRNPGLNRAEALAQARSQGNVLGDAQRLLGRPMRWRPSGPDAEGLTDFARFILSPERFTINPNSTLNCWEMILLAAAGGELKSLQTLQNIYSVNPRNFDKEMVGRFTSWAQIAYDPTKSSGQPLPGDIILFGGLNHVAIATGRRLSGVNLGDNYGSMGGTEIISFWPAPGQTAFGPGATTTVQKTTIEALQTWWQKHGDGSPMKVTFGSPNWRALN